MKNIAVVLRGHVRTWNFNASKVFDFYNKIADNVDYYFTTWDTSSIDGVKETFEYQNLIHFQIISSELDNSILDEGKFEGKYYNGHLGPAFMNTLILPYKRLREKELNQKYDCVFDTRPDVIPQRIKHIWGDRAGMPIEIIPPTKDTVYTTGLELHTNLSDHKQDKDIAIQDWLLYCDSDTFEKTTLRYHSDKHLYEIGNGPGTQIELREYFSQNEMFLSVTDWVRAFMIRPNVFKLDWKDQQDEEKIIKISNEWSTLDSEVKTNLCKHYGVSVNDYADTPSVTCKI